MTTEEIDALVTELIDTLYHPRSSLRVASDFDGWQQAYSVAACVVRKHCTPPTDSPIKGAQ